ncbi:COG1361 S-layer family protein [Helicovermis profundi]|uniref:CARDB domain-containing protein n=1 Tax=Helicovermis profundi TaxID=3065157 RepID=A0AAU9E2L4_9FIRM|nr:hypothetical protein HLPR_08990 [Clostridia bacterium S502]
MFIKNSKFKKMILFTVLMLLIIVSGSAFADSQYISSVSADDSEIYISDTYNLTINLSNLPVGSTYKFLELKSTSIIEPTNGVYKKSISSNKVVFNLKQITDGSVIECDIVYNDGSSDKSVSETIVIPNVKKLSTSSSTSVTDTSKYEPEIKVVEENVPSFNVNKRNQIKFTLENIGTYSAKDINISLMYEGENTPLKKGNEVLTSQIAYLGKNKTKEIVIDLDLSKNSLAMLHQLKVKLSYKNAFGDSFKNDDYSYSFKVINTNTLPIIGIKKSEIRYTDVIAGVKNYIIFEIENTGTLNASDIMVELLGFDKDGIRLKDDVSKRYISSIKGKSTEKIYYAFIPASNAKSGNYELNAKFSYIDETGKKYESNSSVYIYVNGLDSKNIDLKISNKKFPKKINAGDEFSLNFDLENLSDIVANPVEIEAIYPDGIIPTSSPKIYLKTLEKDKKINIDFKFLAKNTLETGNYDFYIKFKYNTKGASESDYSEYKEYQGIFVQGASGMGRPKIIIKNFDFGSSKIMAGDTFNLKLDLFNTSTDEMIKNIKIKIESPDGIFTPVDSSSSVFVEKIDRNSTVEKLIKLKAKNDAEVKTYNLNIIMEYEDSKGNAYDSQKEPYKENEKITIPVSQPIKLEVGEINFPNEISIGRPLDLEINFFNMGKSTIYNLMAKIVDKDSNVLASNYFGNFDAGRTEYFEPTLQAQVAGDVKAKLLFTYEDASGEKGEFSKDINYYVAEETNNIDNGMNFDENIDMGNTQDKKSPIRSIVIAIVLIIIFIISLVIILKKRKKKKQMQLMLEEEDE